MNTHDVYVIVSEAIVAGAEWGCQEIEAWRDQHDGSFATAPVWTRGTYCGALPHDETHDLVEAIIDLEAEKVWNAARDAN